MSKELTLYYIYEDDSGHRYLIAKKHEVDFKVNLKSLQDQLCHRGDYDEDDFYCDLENLLEHFEATTLEGEEYYVVLASDLKGEKV